MISLYACLIQSETGPDVGRPFSCPKESGILRASPQQTEDRPMKFLRFAMTALICVASASAQAHGRAHRHHSQEGRSVWSGSYGPRPARWCGWEMRQLVGRDPGPSYNLARNWSHWGRHGPAGIGAVVVWAHHVARIVGQQNGEWVVESGNDGHALRTRPRSVASAIAIRWE